MSMAAKGTFLNGCSFDVFQLECSVFLYFKIVNFIAKLTEIGNKNNPNKFEFMKQDRFFHVISLDSISF